MLQFFRTRLESSAAMLMTKQLSALQASWERRIAKFYRDIHDLSAARETLRENLSEVPVSENVRPQETPPSETRDKARLRYQVSTLALMDWHSYLTGDERGRERMAIVTGLITAEGVRVLARMEMLPLEQQSAAYVKANDAALAKRVIELHERRGHAPLCMPHSHMMYGAESTQPSQTDIDNQRRFAQLGWEAIGCILSLDGYVRFFDPTLDFTIEVYGKDVELVEDQPHGKVFRLTSIEIHQKSAARAKEAVS